MCAWCVCVSVSVCLSVCVCEREGERESVCVCEARSKMNAIPDNIAHSCAISVSAKRDVSLEGLGASVSKAHLE